MKHIQIEPSEHKVLHDLTLQDLRTCELALAMLIKKREVFGAESVGNKVVATLKGALSRLSDARILCQVAAGQTYVRGDESINAIHCVPQPAGRET